MNEDERLEAERLTDVWWNNRNVPDTDGPFEARDARGFYRSGVIDGRESMRAGLPMCCAYCTYQVPKGGVFADLQKHVNRCPHHPLVKEIDRLDSAASAERARSAKLVERLRETNECIEDCCPDLLGITKRLNEKSIAEYDRAKAVEGE